METGLSYTTLQPQLSSIRLITHWNSTVNLYKVGLPLFPCVITAVHSKFKDQTL